MPKKSKDIRVCVYHSMEEIEKRFFPDSGREKSPKRFSDSQALGASLARESCKRPKDDRRSQE